MKSQAYKLALIATALLTLNACSGGSDHSMFGEQPLAVIEPCMQAEDEVAILTTSGGMEFVRTPRQLLR